MSDGARGDYAQMPLPVDGLTADAAGSGQKRTLTAGVSSPPKRTGMEGAVDMQVLRQLLADQAAMILDSQRQHLDQVLAQRDATVDDRFSRVETRMSAQEVAIQEVRVMVETMGKAAGSRGSDGSTMVTERGDDKYRYTLVWGGWARETCRQCILADLRQVLARLLVEHELDAEPWTTGARRSVALCNFGRRANEGDREVRQRMHRVVKAFAEMDSTVEGKRLWCSYSRSPPERRRAAHASTLKKLVKEHFSGHLDRLDVEFSTGTCWLGDSTISSTADPLPDGRAVDYYVVQGKPEKPWFNVVLLLRELGVSTERVKQLLADAER